MSFEMLRKLENAEFIGNDFAIFRNFDNYSKFVYPIRLHSTIFVVTVSGTLSVGINSKQYVVQPHSLITVLSEHIITEYEPSSDFSGLFLVVSPDFLKEGLPQQVSVVAMLLHTLNFPVVSLNEDEFKRLCDSHKALYDRVLLHDHPYRRDITRYMLTSIFYDVSGIIKQQNQTKEIELSRQEEIFVSFLKLVTDNCHEQRSVKFYADQMGLTPKYLSTTVRNASGKTALEWISEMLIMHAKALLSTTRKSLLEITQALGFANQSFFGKYFKHYVGVSPGRYRQKNNFMKKELNRTYL